MRILHVLDHSLPVHSGYTFRTRAILKAQVARGWEVAGVTGVRYHDGASAQETVDGLTFFRTPRPAPARSPIGEWREVRALEERIDELVESARPDLLHVHSPVLNALAALRVARRRGLPLIYEIRAFWEDAAVGNGTGREGSLRYRATRWLETYVARRADAVAVICEGLKADLIARGIPAAKIMVSPNGVDLELFGDPPPADRALAETLQLEGAEVVGFIGSFYDYEGLDDLIAAMPRLVALRASARLLLVGGGPREESLRAQAEASPVADRIRFVGRVPHEEVERYYSLVDVLAYPRKAMRLTELVTPLKPLEAMAQMRLVAASDVGGHRELIEDGVTGTLFPPGDPDAIAEALARMFAERGGWDARKARARAFVERDRNWSSNIRRYEPVYQRLTGTDRVTKKAKPALSTWLGRAMDPVIALLLAAATAFALFAMPAALVEGAIVGSGLPALLPAAAPPLGDTARTLLALLGASGAGAAAWTALRLVDRPPSMPSRLVVPGSVPQLRRADAHPDAPARRPIFAHADLGGTFDGAAAPLADEPETRITADAPFDLRAALADMAKPLPRNRAPSAVVAETAEFEPIVDAALPEPAVIEAEPEAAEAETVFVEEEEEAPAAAEPATVAALLARLEAGLQRLEQVPVEHSAGNARRLTEDLRTALHTLRPLARRAG